MLANVSKKTLKSESFKRKRRNIVRDWMYFVVWYVRLKRILNSHKIASSPTSPMSILGCSPKNVLAQNQPKSPIQDPT